MKKKRKISGGEAGLNLTPMLGVVFLVLLFFAAAVPLAQERGVDFWAGRICDCGHCEGGPVIFSVDRANRIFVEDSDRPRQIDVRSVRNVVARRLAGEPCRAVLVQAHRQSNMGVVIRVVDEAKIARQQPVSVQIAILGSESDPRQN